MLFVLLLGLFAAANGYDLMPKFNTVHSWKLVDFEFPSEDVRKELIANGTFIQKNNMPLGVQIWQDKIFITVPRWKKGVAANLNYISMNDSSQSPKLIPYPDLASNNVNNPDGIVNVFRVRADPCNRLWGVDSGIEDILGDFRVVRPIRLFVIDLLTDKVLRTYTFKDSDRKPESFFADLVVDVDPDKCDDAHVYISDLGGYGIVVYSWAKNDSWRITHNYFHFDPLQGDYTVSGINFQWTDGVFGMSLSPEHKDCSKTLYFHAMSGITEFSVSTNVLKDYSLKLAHDYYEFHVEGDKGPKTQGPSSLIDPNTSIDYFTQVNKNGIACWDTNVKLEPNSFHLVAQDNTTMVFPNDLAIDFISEKLYVLSDNLPVFQYREYDPEAYNFFLTAADLNALTDHCKR